MNIVAAARTLMAKWQHEPVVGHLFRFVRVEVCGWAFLAALTQAGPSKMTHHLPNSRQMELRASRSHIIPLHQASLPHSPVRDVFVTQVTLHAYGNTHSILLHVYEYGLKVTTVILRCYLCSYITAFWID